MNKASQDLYENIVENLKNTQMNALKIEELISMINAIFGYRQQYEETQFLIKLNLLEKKLLQIQTKLIEFNVLLKKKKGIISFFKQNDEIRIGQQEICKEINEVFQETMKFFDEKSLITASAYTREKQVIDSDFIHIKTNIQINHPKFLPIKSYLDLILKQDPYSNVYELALFRRILMQTIKRKAQQNLNQTQIDYLDKFDKKINTQVCVVSYNTETKKIGLYSEQYPYIITPNPEQNRLYLCEGMKLKFFPNQTLTVLETNTKNENLTEFSCGNDNNQQFNPNVQIKNYGYVKFQFLELDKDQEMNQQNQSIIGKEQQEQQKIPSKDSTFEFYMKNSSQLLSDKIPSINATLIHDSQGFYVLPIKTKFQNYYHLYYVNYLQTKSTIYNFALQIKGKGWIQIETEKLKAERLDL